MECTIFRIPAYTALYQQSLNMALDLHRGQMHNCHVDSTVLLCQSLSAAAVVHVVPSAPWHSALQFVGPGIACHAVPVTPR